MSELLKDYVNEHTEKKGNLTYLSWAWAWAEVLKIDPGAKWEANAPNLDGPALFFPDGSAMVGVSVTIKGDTKGCLLPVMDHRNKAIKNPDAFAINTAIMRCLAKAIAMHGLGLYIYAGEDLPQQDTPIPVAETTELTERQAELTELALYLIDCHAQGKDMDAVRVFYDPETWDKDNGTAQEEQMYLWRLLKTESKLRSMLKANSPHSKKVEA